MCTFAGKSAKSISLQRSKNESYMKASFVGQHPGHHHDGEEESLQDLPSPHDQLVLLGSGQT